MLGLLSARDSAPAGSAPEASVAALNTAARSALFATAESAHGGMATALMAQRYVSAIDVPISTQEVKRWQSTLDLVPSLMESASPESASRFWSPDAVASFSAATGQQDMSVHKLAPFPAFVLSRVVTLPMTKVLRTRRQWLPYRQRFPVHQARIALLDAVLNHEAVALIGGNGTGRTLQLPLMLAETDVFKRRRTVLVVANAVAARLTVRRLREERGEDVETSRTVGCVVPTESDATEGTAILVTTAEVLIRQLLCDPLLQGVGCVIFDDVHLRNEATELCFASMRAALTALRAAAASRATGESDSAAPAQADAATERLLRVVLNCPDETCAAPLLAYFKANGAVPFALPARTGAGAVSAEPVLLNVDETVGWLAKCDKEGSLLCTQPEQQLASLVENVDVVARVLAASESDFGSDVKRRQYWVPLLTEALAHFDAADRKLRAGTSASLPLAVLVAPNLHTQTSLVTELTRALAHTAAPTADEEKQRPAFVFYPLPSEDRACVEKIERLVSAQVEADLATQRLVVVCTPELAQTALPFSLQIGLVLDCARVAYATPDLHTMADVWDLAYASIQSLRYRRAIGRLTVSESSGASADGGAAPAAACVPLVLQLIPKRVLHSTQHRRENADPTHHPLFRLPLARYAQLYQLLQAREEALTCQLSTHDPAVRAYQQQSLSSRIAPLAVSLFVGVPPITSNRYETLRRTLALVEAQLVAAGHLEVAAPTHTPEVTTYARLKPMGVATTCVPLPVCVTRLLCLGAALNCSREAALMAALVLVGDLFADGSHVSRPTDIDDEDAVTRKVLLAEVRQYFSGESNSDMAVSANVYKMWCESRASATAVAATATDSPSESEQAFLDECGASRVALLAVAHLHAALYCQLHRLFPMPCAVSAGASHAKANQDTEMEAEENKSERLHAVTVTSPVTDTPVLREELAQFVRRLPDSPCSTGPLALCLTGALYPSCLVPQADGSAFLLETTIGNQHSTKRVGVFAESSLLSDGRLAVAAAGKPFLYAGKTAVAVTVKAAAEAGSTSVSAGESNASSPATVAPTQQDTVRLLSVVSHVTTLLPAASILLCGEGTEDVRPLPPRCRGWRPALTSSWRRTRLSRTLPPPSQLPTPSITVLPYDTVRAEQVMVSTDATFHYAMRQTTSRWLMQLRRSLQRQLASLTLHRAAAEDDDTCLQLAQQLKEAWAWYEAREKSGKEWLREERAALAKRATEAAAAAATAAASARRSTPSEGDEERDNGAEDNAADEEAQQHVNADPVDVAEQQAAAAAEVLRGGRKLFAFYQFSTSSGTPSAVTAPSVSVAQTARAAAASRAELREAAPSRTVKCADAGNDFTVVTGADAHRVPDTYTGKRPTADEEEIIRMCVESVAESRSRSAEAELLRDKPKVFAFLDPDNEFHEYYLYLLRQRAPDLEILGDNLEELVEFLENLEDELRTEAGLPTRAEMAAADEEQDGAYEDGQWDVIDPDEYAGDGTEDTSVFDTGVQMETEVLHLQKPIGPSFVRPPTTAETAPTTTTTTTGASATAPASIFSAPSTNAAAPLPPSNLGDQPGQTLMDRLMGMINPAPAAGVTPAEDATTALASSTPTAADLLALMDACLPSTAVPDPTAATAGADDGDSPADNRDDPSSRAPNPLARPPPPIPAKDIEERAPSIIVYPLPHPKWGNVPLILVKALGETLGIRVGPAKVVGTVARIMVPNRNVELRALAKKYFTCLGEKIFIFKNDRIIDNPDPQAFQRRRGSIHDASGAGVLPVAMPDVSVLPVAPQQPEGVLGGPGLLPMPATASFGGILGERPAAGGPTGGWPYAPQPQTQSYPEYGEHYASAESIPQMSKAPRTEEAVDVQAVRRVATVPLSKIGVLTDDDEDESSDTSSSSSSSAESSDGQ